MTGVCCVATFRFREVLNGAPIWAYKEHVVRHGSLLMGRNLVSHSWEILRGGLQGMNCLRSFPAPGVTLQLPNNFSSESLSFGKRNGIHEGRKER